MTRDLTDDHDDICLLCGETLEEYAGLVEAFEATGKIICESCFEGICEGGGESVVTVRPTRPAA